MTAKQRDDLWPDDHVEQLKNFWIAGWSMSRIGRALGRTRNAIAGKVHRLGLTPRKSLGTAARRTPAPIGFRGDSSCHGAGESALAPDLKGK